MALEPIEHGAEVFTSDVLHRDKVGVSHFAQIVDLNHVLMMKEHRRFGLLDQHVDEFAVFAEARQDPLDDDLLFKSTDALELGQEDLGHSTLRDFPDEIISSERLDLAQVLLPISLFFQRSALRNGVMRAGLHHTIRQENGDLKGEETTPKSSDLLTASQPIPSSSNKFAPPRAL